MHTLGVEVHPLVVRTNRGSITLNLWDCGGEMNIYGHLYEGWYEGADLAFIFGQNIEEANAYAQGLPQGAHGVGFQIDEINNFTVDTIIASLREVRGDPLLARV